MIRGLAAGLYPPIQYMRTLSVVRGFFAAFGVLFVLIDLSENAGDLLLEQRLEILLRLLVQVVLLAELLGQVRRRVPLVHHDALLLVRPQIHVHEEQGRVRIIEVVLVLLALSPIQTFFLFFVSLLVTILSISHLLLLLLLHLVGVEHLGVLEQLRQLRAFGYVAILSLNNQTNTQIINAYTQSFSH